jgi:hypothetical protein
MRCEGKKINFARKKKKKKKRKEKKRKPSPLFAFDSTGHNWRYVVEIKGQSVRQQLGDALAARKRLRPVRQHVHGAHVSRDNTHPLL